MGKARILEAHGEGRYTIEIVEARERAESAKQQAESRIQTLTAEVNQLDAKIQAAQQAVDQAALEQNAAIEQWQQEVAEQGGSSVDLDAFARKLLESAGKRDALRAENRSKELRIAADQALVARINSLPPLRQMQAWCADYTDDLTGEVATAEVPGEVGNVIIKPGFENANQWSATADGAMQPALAGTPASVFYNLAMKPGWQKWRPTYRTATITSIDGDTCSITLDAATSSQQALSVNARSSYSGVPILYMDCNGEAFEQGDRVLVAFAGNVEGPTVVGFEQEPRQCDYAIMLIPCSIDFQAERNMSDGFVSNVPAALPDGIWGPLCMANYALTFELDECIFYGREFAQPVAAATKESEIPAGTVANVASPLTTSTVDFRPVSFRRRWGDSSTFSALLSLYGVGVEASGVSGDRNWTAIRPHVELSSDISLAGTVYRGQLVGKGQTALSYREHESLESDRVYNYVSQGINPGDFGIIFTTAAFWPYDAEPRRTRSVTLDLAFTDELGKDWEPHAILSPLEGKGVHTYDRDYWFLGGRQRISKTFYHRVVMRRA